MLKDDSHGLFECGYFQAGTRYSEMILEAIKEVNRQLRPRILSIIEIYTMSDTTLQTAIGNSYGDIYETHLDWAKNSRMNTQNEDSIPDGFMDYMMPILKAKM